MTHDITPFTIAIPQARLDDLHARLDRTRWPEQPRGVDGWSRGVPLAYLRDLAAYWRNSYNWREQERALNAFDQYTTGIDGAPVHFLHVRSPEPAALPLIITHGWPGSVAEFLQVLGPLTDPVRHGGEPADAFHVVAPSIPGFGLSGPTPEVGWTAQRVSAAWTELMRRLGYDRYGAHGGDWGAVISRDIGRLDPEHVLGVHLTMLPSAVPTADLDPASLGDLSDAELDRIRIAQRRRQQVQAEEMGYRIIQSTRPQTLAYALTDSPVGQLGWIVEKFKQWTDSADAPEDAVDRDQLLTNVMLYWLTGTAGSSAALYYEVAHSDNAWGAPAESSATPTGVASFGHDLSIPIRGLAEKGNNIVRWSEFEHGGHFAAMEAPEVLVDDIRALFRGLR